MVNPMMASLSRQGARRSNLAPASEHQLIIVARNSAEDALVGRARRLRRANPSLSEHSAISSVYADPCNRHLVLEAV